MTEQPSQSQVAESFRAAWNAHQQDLEALRKELGALSDEVGVTIPTAAADEETRRFPGPMASPPGTPGERAVAGAAEAADPTTSWRVLEQAMIRQAESLRRELAEVEALRHAVVSMEGELHERDERIQELRSKVGAVSRIAQTVDQSLARLRELGARSEDFAGVVPDVEESFAEVRGESETVRCVQEALFSGDFPALRFAVDAASRVLAWNPAMATFSGVSADEARRSPLAECLPPGASAAFVTLLELVKDAKETRVEPVTCRGADGQERDLRVFATPVVREEPSDAGADPVGAGPVEGVIFEALDAARDAQARGHDGTRVQADDDTRVNSRFADALLVSFPGALVVLDGEDRVVNWNTTAEQLFGIPAAEALGAKLFELATPLAKDTYREHFDTHRNSSGAVRAKVNLRTALGNRLCLITQAPFQEPDGTTCGTLLVVEELATR